MPRTGRGGKVTGASNKAYSNRTDLNASVPVEAAPDQPYGEAAQQKVAQNAIPIAPTPVATAPAPSPAAPAQAGGTLGQVSRPTAPEPGSLPFLHPTNRPDEPITAGMNFGPGPGSEVMAPGPPAVSDTFASLAQGQHASPLLSALAAAARTLGV